MAWAGGSREGEHRIGGHKAVANQRRVSEDFLKEVSTGVGPGDEQGSAKEEGLADRGSHMCQGLGWGQG